MIIRRIVLSAASFQYNKQINYSSPSYVHVSERFADCLTKTKTAKAAKVMDQDVLELIDFWYVLSGGKYLKLVTIPTKIDSTLILFERNKL